MINLKVEQTSGPRYIEKWINAPGVLDIEAMHKDPLYILEGIRGSFRDQIEEKMNKQKMNMAEFAELMGESEQFVDTVIFNDQGDISLYIAVKAAQALGLKLYMVLNDE